MGLTRFPNGVTANSTTALAYNTAAGDGAFDCLSLFVSGTSSLGIVTVTSLTATTLTVTNGTATNLTVASAGRFSISTSTAATMIGERAYLPFTFTSAATTAGVIALPFASQVIDCWVACDTTPRTCSGFTLYSGNSASGTVCVASVALAYATAINQQVQPTLTGAAGITGTALAFVVTTAGTAANFYGVVTIQRTA